MSTEERQHDDLSMLRDWKVLVIGLGMTGRSAASFCAARGARVVAVDERPRDSFSDPETSRQLATLSHEVELRMGVTLPPLADFDLVVPSPGVPRARYAGGARRAWGDIELAARALQIPLIAVTGTNGKSTTVRLIEARLKAAGLRARAAGNIGSPALSLVGEPLDAAILEVSSFQLEAVETLRPKVAVVLNITPDHLDRHGSFDAYVDAKAALLARQEAEDVAVLNFDDPATRSLAERTRARVIGFSRRQLLTEGVSSVGGQLCVAMDGRRTLLAFDTSVSPRLSGLHNLENVLAAVASVAGLGIDPARAASALVDFEGLPHRCQEIAEARGVSFFDDSKATNAAAAERSLESFASTGPKVLWIAGGRGKGAALERLTDAAARHARHAYLIGESAGEIESALAGRIPTSYCDSIEEAVAAAADAATAGDVVLLAPGCASFDQFASFEERGDRFAAAARRWCKATVPEGRKP